MREELVMKLATKRGFEDHYTLWFGRLCADKSVPDIAVKECFDELYKLTVFCEE